MPSRYFDGMGADRTDYVKGLEERNQSLINQLVDLNMRIAKLEAKASKKVKNHE